MIAGCQIAGGRNGFGLHMVVPVDEIEDSAVSRIVFTADDETAVAQLLERNGCLFGEGMVSVDTNDGLDL